MDVSIIDVAERAGVSKSTVSRVLTNQRGVQPETRQRVEQAIRELGYRPNALARGLVRGHTRTLGLVVFDLSNVFFALLVHGIEAAARARGYNVLIADSAGNHEQQQECLAMLAEQRVVGVLITPIHAKEEELATIRSSRLKAVLVNSIAGDETVSSVGGDNVQGGQLVTTHLLGMAHSRIGFLGDLRTLPSCQERLAGYIQAHEKAGRSVDPALIVEDLRGMAEVSTAVHHLLSLADPPTALFAVNDQYAIATLQALKERQCRVPDDIALVGYDDLPVTGWLSVPLTTVAQPKEEQGAIAANLLIDQIEGRATVMQRIILPPRLIVRESCGATRRSVQES